MSATTKEDNNENVRVNANSLKRIDVTPSIKTIGKKTATVVKVDVVTAIEISLVPSLAASFLE